MKILFGVFDWGLGHATRDLPLITSLLKRGHKVDILSTGRALILLKNNLGNKCKFYDVPSLYVPYPKHRFFVMNFILSIPKMLKSLKYARKKSKEIINSNGYDVVISDCRYDLYDRKDNSYLINHQLRFKALPVVQQIAELWLFMKFKNYKYIIVPDYEIKSMSGKLSHNLNFISKQKIKYIGILSQLKKKNVKKDIDYFITLSGPEPQRSILQKILLSQVSNLKGKVIITLGLPGNKEKIIKNEKNLKIYSFLNSREQELMMSRSKVVISRSGYTTMMDFAELDKKSALLIPTPGQTEQEYLCDYYENEGYFHHVHQNKLNLKDDIKKIKYFKGFNSNWKTEKSVRTFINLIEERNTND